VRDFALRGRPGTIAEVTAAPDPSQDAPEYDLAEDVSGAAPLRPVTTTPFGATPAAGPPVLAYRAVPQAAVAAHDLYFPNRLRDLYAPAALLVLGLGAGLGELYYLFGYRLDRAFGFGAAYAVVKLVMLAVCIPLITWVAGVAFGTLPQAVLKPCAIAILPEAIGVGLMLLLGPCVGFPLGVVAGFFAAWAMFALLFEFEGTEARFAAAAYWGVGLVFAVGWVTLLNWLLGRVW
jgi:hypothetical protein